MSGQQGSRWGSLLSGAVAGLESRLDTILAEDNQASAKSRAAETAANEGGAEKQLLQAEPAASRTPSRSRPNSRLQDRLARVVKQRGESPKTAPDDPSRPESPAARDEEAKTQDSAFDQPSRTAMPATKIPSITSIPSILTPRTESPRHSFDSSPSRPSDDDPSFFTGLENSMSRTPNMLEAELLALQKTHEEMLSEKSEELHSHLERIDTLQSKLAYLSQQLASQSKAASADSEATSADKKLAEKDAQIAALMEEGQKLSKTEMKHMATLKKMRLKAQETDRDMTAMKQRLSKAEKSLVEQTDRAKRAEDAEKAAQDKVKIVGQIEKNLDHIRAEQEEAGLTIKELRRQLSDALSRVEDAEKRAQAGANEAEKRVTDSLKDDIENIRIEKKLAEERGKREVQEAREEATRQREKASMAELELRGEIANLETKLELLRSRSEEVSSSATGDSQATLLRQIETLQTQYALASENWQGIESTLNSRVAALEKERDETAKRESDIRRKARDINSRARKLEDDLETAKDVSSTLEHDLSSARTLNKRLQSRMTQAEAAAEEARLDIEREKKAQEADLQAKLEEEKSKWRAEMQSQMQESNYLRADSPGTPGLNRKHSPDPMSMMNRRPNIRSFSSDMPMPLSPMDRMLFEDRRPPSTGRTKTSNNAVRSPELGPPLRQDSLPLSMSNLNGGRTSTAPSIQAYDHDDGYENGSSPHRTINDMISVSTAGAGPSVQLVERMSAAVRRLESEKATSKEEMARLVEQRDEARKEFETLLREVDEKRALDQKVGRLDKELHAMSERYETTLQLLGEKSERVDELENDVVDLKKLYRDLVEQKYAG